MALGVVVLAAVPAWVWATLIMAAFAALTVFTMWLARIPTQGPTLGSPPGGRRTDADGEEAGIESGLNSDDA